MTQPYRGRLAPSPTGYLHLGHAATFLVAADRAHAAQGELLLRIDDLDRDRSRPEYITAAREDLHWLGLIWSAEHTQVTRLPRYREAIQQLLASGYAYPCTCSRKDLHDALQAPHDDADEPVYNGRCRPLHPRIQPLAPGVNYRFHVPDGELLTFTDAHLGPQRFRAGSDPHADFGDFLVWRKDGLPSYQLACVLDDADMRITEVVRGRDLLRSTARQLLLQRALELPAPAYFHTDLLRDEHGMRLAKRHDALSLRTLRTSGITPQQLRARVLPTAHHS